MKGQAAVEWIVILSVAILILAVMLSMNEDNMRFFNDNIKVGKAKAALNDLKQACDFVYSQGRDARTRVYVAVPDSTNISISTMQAGGGRIQAVAMVSGKQEIFDVYTDANLTGSVPQVSGGYCVDVEYSGLGVELGRADGSC
ncbi:MAG: hypothetical protein V1875_00695 [Candidatus Altiarchaeota archaeon]